MLTIIKQRKIISEKHIYETDKQFNAFLKDKKPSTRKRYANYRSRALQLRRKGYNFSYDKKSNVYIYSKKGIDKEELTKNTAKLEDNQIYAHIIDFHCEYNGQDFYHTYIWVTRNKQPPKNGNIVHKHAVLFPQHEYLEHSYEGTKIVYR